MLIHSSCVSAVLNKKAHAQNRAALAVASECNMVRRIESPAHSIKAEGRLRGQPVAKFLPGNCVTWNGNALFVALKMGLDEAMPEVQMSPFCAPASMQWTGRSPRLSGRHEHRDPRRQLFARLCRDLCRGEPASSQAPNWVWFNFSRQRYRHHRLSAACMLRPPSA